MTGWFPSNYVKDCKGSIITLVFRFLQPICVLDVIVNTAIITQQQQYRAVVLKDLIDSERAQVTELQGLVNNFLHPLESSSM